MFPRQDTGHYQPAGGPRWSLPAGRCLLLWYGAVRSLPTVALLLRGPGLWQWRVAQRKHTHTRTPCFRVGYACRRGTAAVSSAWRLVPSGGGAAHSAGAMASLAGRSVGRRKRRLSGRPMRGQGRVGPLPTRVDQCDCGGVTCSITSPRPGPCIQPCVFSARFFPRNTGTVFCSCCCSLLCDPTPALGF